jgi:hypothetical protein
MPDYAYRPEKAAARDLMLDKCAPIRSLATLPGRDLICVKRMIELGLIDRDTPQVWIERDLGTAGVMKANAASLGLTPHIEIGNVRRWQPTNKIDFLNLDLEEGFTPKLGDWFERDLSPVLDDKATIILTMTASSRNKDPVCFASWFEDEIARTTILRDTFDYLLSHATHGTSALVIRNVLLVACALQAHHVTLVASHAYADAMPMITFRMDVTALGGASMLPAFSELRSEFTRQFVPRTLQQSRPEGALGLDALATLAANRAFRSELLEPMAGITVARVTGAADANAEHRRLRREAALNELAKAQQVLAEIAAEEEALKALAEETPEQQYRRKRHEAAVKAAATRRTNKTMRLAAV